MIYFFNKNKLLKETQNELEVVKAKLGEYAKKYTPLIEFDSEIENRNIQLLKLNEELNILNEKYKVGLELLNKLEKECDLYSNSIEIGEFGLYQPQFDFDTSESFKMQLEYNYSLQKDIIRANRAAVCRTEWTVNGSKSEGKKQTKQVIKLILFAFNGECDSVIAKVKWNNVTKARERILKSFENINKLGETNTISITEDYLKLKLDELALTYEYEQKKQEEKEEQRRIRELMREEEKAQREFEKAQREAEEEEDRFQKALDKARKQLGLVSDSEIELLNSQISSLEIKLQEAHEKKERAISMAQLTKAGHIYIISNLGSFGENVYKIGMTRRLEPLDRVRELGDASVPFHFDVHAVIYSENAPQLEYELHRKFSDRRLNRKNFRKEFFKVTLDEIEFEVKKHANAEIEFTKIGEAREYRETLALIEELNQVNVFEKEKKFPNSLL
jgi:hypothetical protein